MFVPKKQDSTLEYKVQVVHPLVFIVVKIYSKLSILKMENAFVLLEDFKLILYANFVMIHYAKNVIPQQIVWNVLIMLPKIIWEIANVVMDTMLMIMDYLWNVELVHLDVQNV